MIGAINIEMVAAAEPTFRQASASPAQNTGSDLFRARAKVETKVKLPRLDNEPIPTAPDAVFRTIKYPSPVGDLGAYLTPDPKDGKRHPAIIWITGGDCNSIGDVWSPKPRANDQSAAAYRRAGIVMMFPSLRGGNDNPGNREAFYGETNDILAAANYLASQSYVDPKRIYLGGHSTGGTMVLLTAEVSSRFRATFSIGPVAEVNHYGPDLIPFDFNKLGIAGVRELQVRWPGTWLHSIHSPVFILEGEQDGNMDDFKTMKGKNNYPLIKFVSVPNAGHFSILAPANELLAERILADDGENVNIKITAKEIAAIMDRAK
jgi:dipeptidyl aminopeptidase/acylaminoacyl peptidase